MQFTGERYEGELHKNGRYIEERERGERGEGRGRREVGNTNDGTVWMEKGSTCSLTGVTTKGI